MPCKDASVASLMQMLHGAVALGLFQSREAEHEWRVVRHRPQNLGQQSPVTSHSVCLRWALTRPFNQWTRAINCLTPQVAPYRSTPNAGDVKSSPTSTAMTYTRFIRSSHQSA